MKKGIVIVLAIVLSFAILTVGNNFADSVAASGSAGGQTLTATEKGFGGDVTVTVTVDGDKIVDVKAEGPDETEGIGSMAIDELPAKIVEANSADIDGVSGATYTSNAIKEAVKTALASGASSGAGQTLTATAEGFGGDVTVTVTVDGDKIVDVKAEGPDETEGIGSMAIDELPAKIVEANSADIDGVSGATFTSNAIKEAVNNALGK